MTGIVSRIQADGFVQIKTTTYLSVVEPLGEYHLEVGDEIRGNLDRLGSEILYNVSRDENIGVIIQDLI